ncbi:MAG: GHMP kinase [Candidatus Nanoarchaeia archaeon]|nr:GHMP kinase [Candidatus Nanoarchaeia archaeon]
MIISRTPLRISFCGGGTDQKNYWEKHDGAVISTSIDKYIYIIVKKRHDNQIWLKYSQNETVDNIDDINHGIWRECLRHVGITKGVEIVALADVPKGTGLGGSSAFTVGTLNALYALKGISKSSSEIAKEACEIEIDVLKEPIGKQDQYACAVGGLNLIEFKKNGEVIMNPLIIDDKTGRKLSSNLLLFYTGVTRDAKEVLTEQQKNTDPQKETLHKMKEFAYLAKDALHSSDFLRFGELLHENWEYKKRMASNLSNSAIDKYYDLARESGAVGGKICGAGGGGFFLFYVEPEKQDKVRNALKELKEFEFNFESFGSKIIYIGEK